MKHFPFLDLPPEIRDKIYILVSTSPSQILLNQPHAHESFPLNLLLTNTQIYHECRPLYFAVNTFAITLLRRNETWDYILSPSFLDNRRQIRSLRLNIVRWGPKNYFVNKLMPVLEDCIMNGRLREVEVRMRDVWCRGLERETARNVHLANLKKEVMGQENANWESLMRLLRDPYLESAALMAGPMKSVGDERRLDMDQSQTRFLNVKWLFNFEEGGGWNEVLR